MTAGRTSLTTRGRCLLAGGIATAACAVPLDERDLLRVGAFVALLPLLALLLALLSRRTVRVRRALSPERVPVGATVTVTLHVAGGTAMDPLELTDTVPDAAGAGGTPRFVTDRSPAGRFGGRVDCSMVALHQPDCSRATLLQSPEPPQRRTRAGRFRAGRSGAGSSGVAVRYPLHPVLRGAHRVGPLIAHAVDPLGLAEFARPVPGTDRLLVLPRVTVLHGLPPALGSADGAHGAGSAGSGQGRSDVHVRPYRSGDELRRVHWRSTARHDELMVRLEEHPWRGGVTVLLDRRAAAHRGHGPGASLEWAVAFAASVCVHLLGRGEPVALVTEDGGRLTGPSTPGADPLLDALATLRPSAATDLGGPPLPGAGDLLAVLGAAAPEELEALLVRRTGGGHAVLLDVAAWSAPAAPAVPVAATAAALRRAGWVVAVAGPGTPPERVWNELVTSPAPQAGALGMPQ
jgi:uncharacterized protein (DUF58 family)